MDPYYTERFFTRIEIDKKTNCRNRLATNT